VICRERERERNIRKCEFYWARSHPRKNNNNQWKIWRKNMENEAKKKKNMKKMKKKKMMMMMTMMKEGGARSISCTRKSEGAI
jgi:hypothetical protein